MAIQTDVTLQPDYRCCLSVMGDNPALQKLLPACPSSTIVNTRCVIFVHKVASLVVTAHYNTSVSEEISMFAAWSAGNDRARRFGCREIKALTAPIIFNTLPTCCFVTARNAFLTFSLTTT